MARIKHRPWMWRSLELAPNGLFRAAQFARRAAWANRIFREPVAAWREHPPGCAEILSLASSISCPGSDFTVRVSAAERSCPIMRA